MSDPERCKFFLEQILDIQIDHVEYLEKQKTIDMKIDARSVRLDIYMSDGKAIYNVEMQTTSGKNLPKRSRYY
ncbi:MAG: PD-(D/E)XK nuclease family transposase, partial [Lachnospiraceae bacterium]|nr:PD-(D/E)XK nuclease family transposase [Lachnospiraceae bacterium]